MPAQTRSTARHGDTPPQPVPPASWRISHADRVPARTARRRNQDAGGPRQRVPAPAQRHRCIQSAVSLHCIRRSLRQPPPPGAQRRCSKAAQPCDLARCVAAKPDLRSRQHASAPECHEKLEALRATRAGTPPVSIDSASPAALRLALKSLISLQILPARVWLSAGTIIDILPSSQRASRWPPLRRDGDGDPR